MFREFELDVTRSLAACKFLSRLQGSDPGSLADSILSELIDEAAAFIDDAMPGADRRAWEAWLVSARYLESESMLATSLANGVGVADAKAAKEIRLEQLSAFGQGLAHSDVSVANARACATATMSLPLPNLYWHVDHSWEEFRNRHSLQANDQQEVDEENATLPEVVRLAVFVDDFPMVTPQEVRPAAMYQLRMDYRLPSIPDAVRGIQFEFLSTLSRNHYSISDCVQEFPPREAFDSLKFEASCTLVFPFEQSDPFQRTVLAASAFLLLSNGRKRIPVIGHDQLQFRVRAENSSILSSGFRRMDVHVQDLLQKLVAQQPSTRNEVKALLPLLDALVAVQSTFAQGGVFQSRSVSEAEFQQETLKCLRMKLGEDVQEAPRQAGGTTDIRFRGAVVELKVENTLSDRSRMALKYGKQATQYQGVEARSIAIVLCLDLTEKDNPPGDLRNDVVLERIDTNDPAPFHPSWVLLFAVQGNLRSPSSYSR